jgi:TctA family transporter
MTISSGDATVFLTSPISAFLLCAAVLGNESGAD